LDSAETFSGVVEVPFCWGIEDFLVFLWWRKDDVRVAGGVVERGEQQRGFCWLKM
jgi:hypothetical protein